MPTSLGSTQKLSPGRTARDSHLPTSPPCPFGGHRTGRCWELRDDLSIYDAAYVALAEALEVILLTADQRLARSAGPGCRIEVLR